MREGWTYTKFSDVFDLQMGKTPSRDNPQYWGGENTWVSIADIQQKYIGASKENISDKAIADTNIKVVKKGTVIMSFKLTVGRCAITTKDLYTNEAIMSFTPINKSLFIPEYIYYFLRGCRWVGANKAVMGMTLNKKSLSSNTFAYPPLSEQQRIVSELDLLSSIIEKKKEQLKAYDQLAQSIFYDLFGDPVDNPKGWEVKKLGEVCDVRDGTHDSPKYLPSSEYVLITSKNIQGDSIDYSTANFISKEDYDNINKRSFVDDGDIIMAMIGTIGKPIIVHKNDIKFCVKNVALIKFVDGSKVINVFIKALLDNKSFMTYINGLNKGGTQKFVALGTIRNLSIPLPPLSLQQSFAEKIEAIEKQKELIKLSITETETLFNSRMDYYFN